MQSDEEQQDLPALKSARLTQIIPGSIPHLTDFVPCGWQGAAISVVFCLSSSCKYIKIIYSRLGITCLIKACLRANIFCRYLPVTAIAPAALLFDSSCHPQDAGGGSCSVLFMDLVLKPEIFQQGYPYKNHYS